MSQALISAANRLENWIKEDAIPLWVKRGINPQTGASYERLKPDGFPDEEASLRVRVQARQIFFFAVAYERGWCAEGKDIALRMLDFLQSYARHPHIKNAYVHLLNKDLSIADAKQDLYDYAFIILAYAWVYRITQDEKHLDSIDALFMHIETTMTASNGGWVEGDYVYKARRQNPHMHLTETFLTLYGMTKNSKWLTYADTMFALFKTVFFDEKQQVLYEFFDENWKRLIGTEGDIVEPGHMLEWVWLLDWYSKQSRQQVEEYTHLLYQRAIALGMDQSGLLYDAVSADGKIINHTKRCWPMTELIKASLVQLRAGDASAGVQAVNAVNHLFSYFLCTPTKGAYIDQRDEQNLICNKYAPASTLYHIMIATTELVDHVKK
jgi:mannose/cellobiose epimerase-like protein (N-acyl-D-glucosamine 2-epimerase family)